MFSVLRQFIEGFQKIFKPISESHIFLPKGDRVWKVI
jgi:hypothetical protein